MKCIPRGYGRFVTKVFLLGLFCFVIAFLTFYHPHDTPPIHKIEVRSVIHVERPSTLLKNKSHTNSSDDVVIQDIQERMPNLPIVYWNAIKKKPPQFNSSCAIFPSLFGIEFNNGYWQTLRTSNGTFQLFGAYLDVRRNNQNGPTVRLLGMLNRIQPTVVTYCQFWYADKKQPVIEKSLEYKYIWVRQWGNYKQGIYQPYLINCKIPEYHTNATPVAISLVEKPCDNATNSLRVIYNKPEEKKDFAVCVKGLAFPQLDLTFKLAEWIELLNLLGADKIFFYELEVHPNVSKLLHHYQKEGKVHVTPLKLAGGQPNAPLLQSFFLKKKLASKRQNELIPYNDCFYTHMYEYKYIALLDIDEVIMPVNHASWKELIDKVSEEAWKIKMVERASFNVRNVYFLDDLLHDHGWFEGIPEYMHMLQHVYRAKNYTRPGFYIKSFHNTEKVLALHNHYPLFCLGSCYSYAMDTSDAQLQHYRSDCVNELKKSCANFRDNSVMDTNIWKFKEPLVERVVSTLTTLGFI